MYDPILLQRRMAEQLMNYRTLAKRAGVDPKTAKSVVTTGKGQPESIRRIAKALGYKSGKRILKGVA